MVRFFVFFIILLLALDAYLWLLFTHRQQGMWRTLLVILPTVITLGCMLMAAAGLRINGIMQLAAILLACVIVPKLGFVIFDLLARLLTWGHEPAYRIGQRIALIVAVALAGVQIYGCTWGWKRLVTARTVIKTDGLPKTFRHYRIVQISDLHLGSYGGDTTFVSRVVDSINARQPDLIVFSGDIVNTSSDELRPFLSTLARLRARDGVVSVLGNHDYCMYQPGSTPAEQAAHTAEIIKMQRAMGWHLLLNEHLTLRRGSDSLVIAGVENTGKPPFPERGDLPKALKGVAPGACTILVSHDPWHWHHGVVGKAPVALTLSGHTHAMQLRIGSFSPARWVAPEWGGLYRDGRQQLFVSTGVGGNVPYRLGAWPEIDLLELI